MSFDLEQKDLSYIKIFDKNANLSSLQLLYAHKKEDSIFKQDRTTSAEVITWLIWNCQKD
jgi:hypothetical protein